MALNGVVPMVSGLLLPHFKKAGNDLLVLWFIDGRTVSVQLKVCGDQGAVFLFHLHTSQFSFKGLNLLNGFRSM